MQKKKYLFVFIFVLLTFIAIFHFKTSQVKKNIKIPILRLGHAPHDHHSALYVAAMNPDFFKENTGIYLRELEFKKEYELIKDDKIISRVLIDSSTGGKELIRKLAEEHFDISFGGVGAMLFFIDQGYSIKIIAPIMNGGDGLVVRKDFPVNSWSEFISFVKNCDYPLKIGYKIKVSTQNLIFENSLKEEGISFSHTPNDKSSKINLINLYGAKNLIPALKNGLIDGFVVNQPFIAKAEIQGVGKIITTLSKLSSQNMSRDTPCCALCVNQDFLNENYEVVESFLKLIMKSTEFINENQSETVKFVSKWLNVNPKVEEKSIPSINFGTDFDDDWKYGISFWIDILLKKKSLKNIIRREYESGNLETLLYDEGLYKTCGEKS